MPSQASGLGQDWGIDDGIAFWVKLAALVHQGAVNIETGSNDQMRLQVGRRLHLL